MAEGRWNLIMLVGEDVGCHLGCCGDHYARTPNLDRLADEGGCYTNMIATAPVCAPSRSSLVTGMYPWSLGTHHMRSTLLSPPRLFTHELRDAGYYVNWHTKTDFNFEPPADFADDTDDWLDTLRDGALPSQPFFLFRNFSVTHESTMWDPRRFDQGEKKGSSVMRVAKTPDLPAEHRHDPAAAPVPTYLPDDPQVRQSIAWYYDALSIQDAEIGAVLDALAQSPYADNTAVIYLSDHGRGLPREKRWCYDAGVHVPLIVRWPGEIEPGRRIADVVSGVDIAPTVLSIAGVTIPEHCQSRAFLGPARPEPREVAFAGRDRMDEAYDHVRVARDRRWHYIRNGMPNLPYAQRVSYMERMAATQALRRRYADGELTDAERLWMSPIKPTEELYDAQRDPEMIRNLADDPTHAPTLARLRAALDTHLEAVGDLGRLTERELIGQGRVKDRLAEYAQRIEPLPSEQRMGPERTVLERQEALAYEQGAGAP